MSPSAPLQGGPIEGFEAQVRLWGLRLLAYAACRPDPPTGFGHSEAVGFMLGLEATELDALSPQDLHQRIRRALQAAERSRSRCYGTLADNLAHLANLFDLDVHEAEPYRETDPVLAEELKRPLVQVTFEENVTSH